MDMTRGGRLSERARGGRGDERKSREGRDERQRRARGEGRGAEKGRVKRASVKSKTNRFIQTPTGYPSTGLGFGGHDVGSMCPPVHLSTCSCQSVHLPVHLSTRPLVHLSICSPVHLSTQKGPNLMLSLGGVTGKSEHAVETKCRVLQNYSYSTALLSPL